MIIPSPLADVAMVASVGRVFEAGKASAKDPKYTVVPQRERLRMREAERAQ